MSILSPAFKSYIRLRQSAIDNFLLNPIDTQKQVFNELIGSGQFTAYGKRFNFERINDILDFKASVPIAKYNDLKPYIDRVLGGEQNVLWNSPITWFAKSSGTTCSRSKFIPVSKETLDDNHYKSGKDVLSLYLHQHPESSLMRGKCLAIGGSHQINQLNADSFCGDLSAVMLQNMSFMGHQLHALDLSIALMDEWEAKLEAIANHVIHENITFIAGVPTWTLVLIKRILEITAAQDISEVWPNLELYIHGGVSFAPYREQFQHFIPLDNMHYIETYNASEGFFAAQDNIDEDGMLLFLNHGIFYEFMPIEELGKSNPKTLQLKEVSLNQNYALVISTNSGLWRYLVGDTIRFTSLNPYRIKVSGRIQSFMNAFGEEVIVENSDAAIAEAAKKTGAIVNDYTAAPIFMSESGNGGHEWVIEFDVLPVPLKEFVSEMDEALQRINSDYQAKRHKDIALRFPTVHQIPKGGFNLWLKQNGKLGGQHKIPRLSNDRAFLEDILKYIDHLPAGI